MFGRGALNMCLFVHACRIVVAAALDVLLSHVWRLVVRHAPKLTAFAFMFDSFSQICVWLVLLKVTKLLQQSQRAAATSGVVGSPLRPRSHLLRVSETENSPNK